MADPARRWRIGVWGAAVAIMLAALVASRTVDGFNWTPGDFLGAAVILAAVCLAWELAVRQLRGASGHAGAALGILGALLIVWINLAVGIIGAEDNRANLIFFAVVGAGGLAALAVRFRPIGMARVMGALTTAQVLLAAGLLAARLPHAAALTLLIGALWGGSALLYRRAAGDL